MVQGILRTAKQTAQSTLLLQNSALVAAKNMEINNALAERMLKTIVDAKENFEPLKELFDSLTLLSRTWHAIFSKGTAILFVVSAFMATSVISISCCFGPRCGYCLALVYCKLMCGVLHIKVQS